MTETLTPPATNEATHPPEPDGGLDYHPSKPAELSPKKASRQILRHEIEEGLDALERPAAGLFASGLSAGLDVGFSLFLMAVMLTQADGVLPKPVVTMLVANMYAVGFIFVVLGRSELFTEQTTLAVLPVLSRRVAPAKLLRLWGIVYTGNLIGATFFAWLITIIGPALGVVDPQAFSKIAHQLTNHGWSEILLSALLAGWLMGLLSWLVAAGRDTISQILVVWLITTSIGFAKLHHVILGTVEVMAGYFAGRTVTVPDVLHFLVWATLGNTIGGAVFVAFIKYGHTRPDAQTSPST